MFPVLREAFPLRRPQEQLSGEMVVLQFPFAAAVTIVTESMSILNRHNIPLYSFRFKVKVLQFKRLEG